MSAANPAVVVGSAPPKANAPGLLQVTASRHLETFDPVAAFRRISANGRGFILDGASPEPGAGRFVYVGVGDCEQLKTGPGTELGDVNPELALRDVLSRRAVVETGGEDGEDARFVSGAVGYFGYEAVRHFEPSVGDIPGDPLGLPESAFFLPDRFVVYDRQEQVLTAVKLVAADADSTARGRASVEAERLLDAAAVPIGGSSDDRAVRLWAAVDAGAGSDSEAQAGYEAMVRRARKEIIEGELIQVVLSQRVVRRTDASPVDVYAALAELNPSPYMFMLNFGDFSVVGASPELMVRSRGDEVSMHPIAGTRSRGKTPEEDVALEAELLASGKEQAEHVMLVDLARNDIGRVSVPGSVGVSSFMATERYSHVMHLVSRVRGTLKSDADGLSAFVAGFPLGTLTGAPRLRAVELIAELEGAGRGPYCGGVGWFDASGDVDTGTAIRCVVMKDGEAHIQGGGGVVFDSDPEREYLESLQKMAAQIEAVEIAEEQHEIPIVFQTARRHFAKLLTQDEVV